MFSKSAHLYDMIYKFKDYADEAARVDAFIKSHSASNMSPTLLDVACGTGEHLVHLSEKYTCEGLDLDEGLLEVARQKLPEMPFHHADMIDFDLGKRYSAVVCLFSAIGYVKTVENLHRAVAAMSRHVAEGGVLLIEPSFAPEKFIPNTVHALHVDEPDLKISRINLSTIEDGCGVLNFHYLVATSEGIEYFTERHTLALFPAEAYIEAFELAGLRVEYDAHGVDGRGMYIGRRR